MNELYILRHCKSDFGGSLSHDRERTLSERGLDDAGKLGRWMKTNEYEPAHILCSAATRAMQTAQLVCQALACGEKEIHYLSDLYLASCTSLLSIIADNRNKAEPLLIVAHNPGLDELVNYLANKDVPLTNKGKLMSSGCLARFRLPAVGQDLQHSSELLSITRPSDI